MDTLQTIIVALIGGGAVGFIEFLIKRKDEKSDKNSEVIKAIKDLGEKVDKLETKIDSVNSKGDERDAIQARIRILRCTDELRVKQRHTKDWFDQVMSDITLYEEYTSSHPNFKNHQTAATIKYFNDVYAERLAKNDWV